MSEIIIKIEMDNNGDVLVSKAPGVEEDLVMKMLASALVDMILQYKGKEVSNIIRPSFGPGGRG